MKAFRALSLIVTVLLFISGSVTMAIARHQPRVAGEIELCTGYGLVSVSVDANGKPTGPVMPCPDATQALAALTEVSLPDIRTPGNLVPVRFVMRNLPSAIPQVRSHHHSRAPPVTA
ncbi:MAG: hypothetical protein KJZ59_01550 [Pararhodobacter sp.]|nr:hypothetical protein [Pararhodobacter sp.]